MAQLKGTTAFVASQTYTWEFENDDKKAESKDVVVSPKEVTQKLSENDVISETSGGKSGKYMTSARPKDGKKESVGSAGEEAKVWVG